MQTPSNFDFIVVTEQSYIASDRREFLTSSKRAAEPTELYTVPSAGHVDLYDRVTLIPFDKLTSCFGKNLVSRGA